MCVCSPAVTAQLSNRMGPAAFSAWFSAMQALLNQPGIEYLGAVNHDYLYAHFASAGFLLYPTNFPETGCITAMKAMLSGLIPITSRFADSVLHSLTAEFDMGPDERLSAQVGRDPRQYALWVQDQWVPAVIAAAGRKGLDERRRDMMVYAEKSFSWKSTASIFEDTFFAGN